MTQQRGNYRSRIIVKVVIAALSAALLSSCTNMPGVSGTGGVGSTVGCDDPCMQQRAADQEAATAARAASAADAALVADLTAKRAAAIRAIDNAIADFIHRRPPSVPLDEGSPTLVMLRSLQNMKTQIQNTPLGGMIPAYDEARGLLDRAYMHAVNIGMFDPRTVGQQNASDTWWYISS